MEMKTGSCRFGLWRVRVVWSENLIHKVTFSRTEEESFVPKQIRLYLTAKNMDFFPLKSIALSDGYPYREIYKTVSEIPYGLTKTYSEIAEIAGTHHRTVGVAMKRNPTPLIVPCHRVVSKSGIGGFTPDTGIKKALLDMEKQNAKSLGFIID
ncbi:MAG: methylated-DNA--[protein]-cysteine S-methyltransferase [Methanomicrobiaceae archaeon]|nr:methylated-DNA--[protein]-cysteine S-methyltransferase [Methanomicrobiaceae archaeon]